MLVAAVTVSVGVCVCVCVADALKAFRARVENLLKQPGLCQAEYGAADADATAVYDCVRVCVAEP